jgi:hypothetical protein
MRELLEAVSFLLRVPSLTINIGPDGVEECRAGHLKRIELALTSIPAMPEPRPAPQPNGTWEPK